MPVKIFFCYAREDEAFLINLKSQLISLQREGLVDELWHDRDISAGSEWECEIDEHLNTAHIILLLVSPDFMTSEYCYSKEMKRAMERHHRREARVIPIILRPVDWKGTPFRKLQALPKDAKPIKSWDYQEEAFFNVAKGVRKVVEELSTKSSVTSATRPMKVVEESSGSHLIILSRVSPSPTIKILLVIGITLIIGSGIVISLYLFSSPPTALKLTIASLNASISNPYSPHVGKLIVNDALKSTTNGWDTSSSCQFTGAAYHVKAAPDFNECDYSLDSVSNFIYQIQMKFVTSDTCGGIIFREQSMSGGIFTNYQFKICTDGSWEFGEVNVLYTGLRHGFNLIIQKGLDQANVIAAVVKGTSIDLYVNGMHLVTVINNASNTGQIGIMVTSLTNASSEVAFSDAKVWTL
jgi:TIR domain